MTGDRVAEPESGEAPEASGARRRNRVVLGIVVVLVLGTAGWWVFEQSRHATLLDVGSNGVWGVRVEAGYSPVMPVRVTGAALASPAGSDPDGTLYAVDLADEDGGPAYVDVGLGKSVSLTFALFPDCSSPVSAQQAKVTLQTDQGARMVSLDTPGLDAAVSQWCGTSVEFH